MTVKRVTVIPRRDYETFDSLFNRWKRLVEKENILVDYYRHDAYEKPCAIRKRKRAAAKKRWQRQQMEMDLNRKAV